MSSRPARIAGFDVTSRAPATPAKTATRSRSPRRRPTAFARTAPGGTRGRADRPRRARLARGWKRASASTATNSTRRSIRSKRGSSWSIPKGRRVQGGFPGATRIQAALAEGRRKRVGLRLGPRAGARGRRNRFVAGAPIGRVTSGGFGPTVAAPIAMGYVATPHAEVGTPVGLVVRGKPLPATVAALPFQPHAYYRG